MNEHGPFLRGIAAAPDDPAPRLIYADWLEERGDVRSEFIRLHARLAEQPKDKEFFQLLEREQAIRPGINERWLKVLGYDDVYVRLFRLDEGLWLEDSQEMLRWGSECYNLGPPGMRLATDFGSVYVRQWDGCFWRGVQGLVSICEGYAGGYTNVMEQFDVNWHRKSWDADEPAGFDGLERKLIRRFGRPSGKHPNGSLVQWRFSTVRIRLTAARLQYLVTVRRTKSTRA